MPGKGFQIRFHNFYWKGSTTVDYCSRNITIMGNCQIVEIGKSQNWEKLGFYKERITPERLPKYGRFHYFQLEQVSLVRPAFLIWEWINNWEKFPDRQFQNIVNWEGFFFLDCQFTTKYSTDSKTRKLFPELQRKGNFSQIQFLGICQNIHPWNSQFSLGGVRNLSPVILVFFS